MAMRFYFDFISPYAYLAWTQLRTREDLEPIPILFAAVLDAVGNIGPAEIPAKRSYIIRDIGRIAHRFGVPLYAPPSHPFNPLLALRLCSLDLPRAQKIALIDDLYKEIWTGGRGVTDREVVAEIAARHGVDVARADEAKAVLRERTDAAIAAGVFGVPTMVVDDQMFWGCDSLPHLETYLREGNVVDPQLVAKWEALPASSVRKRL